MKISFDLLVGYFTKFDKIATMKLKFTIMGHMPLVAIQGGLGNQLFQWFYGHDITEQGEFRLYPIFPLNPKINPVRELEVNPLIANCKHVKGLLKPQGVDWIRTLRPRVFDRLWRFTQLASLLHFLGYFREDPRSDTRSHAHPPAKVRYAAGYFLDWKIVNHQLGAVRSELLPVLSQVFVIILWY
jgi:hypothetical protein